MYFWFSLSDKTMARTYKQSLYKNQEEMQKTVIAIKFMK